jgi:hypothetical protein
MNNLKKTFDPYSKRGLKDVNILKLANKECFLIQLTKK